MKQFLLFVLCLSLFTGAFAQRNSIKEVRKGMSLGVKEAFTVDIENLNNKEVEKVLMNYLKDFKGKKNPKMDRKTDEILTDDAEIPGLSTNTIDVYASLEGKGDNSTVTFWFDLGGAFLSEDNHPEKMEALSEWLYAFGLKTRVRTIELELEEEEKRLKEFNKNFDKLVKEQEKLEATIRKAEEAIKNAQKDLENNAADQENSREIILEQQKMIEKVKDKLKKIN